MIVGILPDDGLLIGLSAENLKKMRRGQPISRGLEVLGRKGRLIIFAGTDEAAMLKSLRELGLLPADVPVTHHA